MAASKQTEHEKLTQAARAKHGRIVSRALPSGELLIFRAPTREEVAAYRASSKKRVSARMRQLAQQCCVHPRSDDKSKPVEELKAIMTRRPGIPAAATRAIMMLAGDEVTFTESGKDLQADDVETLRADGAEQFGLCPDGECVGVRCPTEAQFVAWQDGEEEKFERDETLARCVLVGDLAALSKYPALASEVAATALLVAGTTLEFEAKKD